MRFWRKSNSKASLPVVVTFTGGMGAQVISAAIYFAMKRGGQAVYADLSYFQQPEDVAQAGQAGKCSHWAWQLGLFGLTPEMFDTNAALNKRNAIRLEDGPQKLERALEALAQPEVREHFKVAPGLDDVLPGWGSVKFLCIHIRRGDYVNVASHLVSDEEFLALASKVAGLLDRAIVLSDSPLSEPFRAAIAAQFSHVRILDQTDVETAHRIMRNASMLVCSNSQFSLIAAALNPQALALIPRQWFGGADRAIEAPLHARCAFQILDT